MQNLLSNRLVPSLALSLLGAATAQAETPIALPDMEVSTWGNSLSPPDSVAREDFQRFDRRDVGEALNTLPGVYLQGGGNRNERQVSVRGFDSRQVPLFIDGVPVYVPYDGNIDLGRFLTSDLAGIEVSKGYASLLQGPNMLGGRSTWLPSPDPPLRGRLRPQPGLGARRRAGRPGGGFLPRRQGPPGLLPGQRRLARPRRPRPPRRPARQRRPG